MRTILLTMAWLLCCLTASAQDNAMLAAIEKANAAVKSMQGRFVQTEKSLAKGKEEKSQGMLYIADADKMAMHYEAPSTDLLIINGADFYLKRGKRDKRYNTEKNAMMRRLSNTLLLCVHGQPGRLAEEMNAQLSAEKRAEGYVITLTTAKKQPRGYAKIVLTYDLRTHLLTRMQMDEFNGNSTTYALNGIQSNTAPDASVFVIP